MTVTINTRGRVFEAYCSAAPTPDGKRHRDRRSGFLTWAEAHQWGTRREAELSVGQLDKKHGPSVLTDLAAAAFDRFWSEGRSAPTYESNIRFILDTLGDTLKITTISEAHLEQLRRACKTAGNSNATINRKMACLGKMLRWALSQGWVSRVPDFETLKEGRGRIRWPTDSEEAEVISRLRVGNPDYADLVTVLADSGLRVSEALNLQWKDVDYSANQIHVWESKNDKPRTVPMTKRMFGVLLGREDGSDAGPFEGLLGNTLNYLWNRVKADMGLQEDAEFVPHCLRHGVASRLVQAGIPLLTIKELLGHARIETTLIYAHLAPRNLDQAAKILDRKG